MRYNEITYHLNFWKKLIVLSLTILVQLIGIIFSLNAMNLAEIISSKLVLILIYSFICVCLLGARIRTFGMIIKSLCCLCIWIIIISFCKLDFSSVLNSISLLLSVIILYWVLSKYIKNEKDSRTIYLLITIGTCTALLISIIRYGIIPNNSLGILISTCGIMFLNIACIFKPKNFLLIFAIVVTFVLILAITRSRTSMLAFLITSLISFYTLFLKKFTIKSMLILIISIIFLAIFSEALFIFFEEIFFEKWQNGDLSSGREEIWQKLIETISLTGHKPIGIYEISGIKDAHNSFLQVLGAYGVISLSIFLLTIFLIIFKAKEVKRSIQYFNFFSGWLVLSMTENLDLFTTRILPVTILFVFNMCMLDIENRNFLVNR